MTTAMASSATTAATGAYATAKASAVACAYTTTTAGAFFGIGFFARLLWLSAGCFFFIALKDFVRLRRSLGCNASICVTAVCSFFYSSITTVALTTATTAASAIHGDLHDIIIVCLSGV